MLIWSLGFFTGFLLFLATCALFLFKLFLYPKLNRKLPEFIKPKELPDSVIYEIKRHLKNEENTEETALWLNSIVNWLFLNLFDSPPPQNILNQIVSEIAVDLRRSPLGYFLTGSELKSIEIGGTAPRIQNAKIITGSALKDPSSAVPLTIRFDLEYDGICRVLLSFETIFNFKISQETLINSFKGSFIVVIQDRTVHFCFLSEPTILKVDTNTSCSEDGKQFYRIPLLNRILSGWLFKKLIRFASCFPNFTGHWYRAGPDQPPYPWTQLVITNSELLYSWTPKLD